MIIDMKKQVNKSSVFSKQLIDAIKQNLENKKQTILLINRRGFSTHTICEACGNTIECKKCSIPLIYHRANNRLRCHYCNFEQNLITVCPECGSQAIKYSGIGTQRVE
jgi:primosomal protein N' (replication factor Y)